MSDEEAFISAFTYQDLECETTYRLVDKRQSKVSRWLRKYVLSRNDTKCLIFGRNKPVSKPLNSISGEFSHIQDFTINGYLESTSFADIEVPNGSGGGVDEAGGAIPVSCRFETVQATYKSRNITLYRANIKINDKSSYEANAYNSSHSSSCSCSNSSEKNGAIDSSPYELCLISFKILDRYIFASGTAVGPKSKHNSIFINPTRYNFIWNAVVYLIKLLVVIIIVLIVLQRFSSVIYVGVLVACLGVLSLLNHFYDTMAFKPADKIKNKKSFFLNGWNGFSYCGVYKFCDEIPMYGLPGILSRPYHDSGALANNLKTIQTLFIKVEDGNFIASDMFTALANKNQNSAVILGFISQKQQFGFISTNMMLDRICVTCSLDYIVPASGQVISNDWLLVDVQDQIQDDPFQIYAEFSGEFNNVSLYKYSDSGSSAALESTFTTKVFSSVNNATSFNKCVPVGWCSWYYYFGNLSDKILKREADLFAAAPWVKSGSNMPHVFQIDDGYQTNWGDWLDSNKSKISEGDMVSLIEYISRAGLLPGLWLAPFACDTGSKIAKDHPDWILRFKKSFWFEWACNCPNHSGITSGINNCFTCNISGKSSSKSIYGKMFYCLDLTLPAVQNHVKHFLSIMVNDWKVKYFKLDFLYAAGICDSNYSDRSVTRAQVIQIALNLIRSVTNREDRKSQDNESKCSENSSSGLASPSSASNINANSNNNSNSKGNTNNTFILGCGAPMGSVIGFVHANRISADTATSWLPKQFCVTIDDKWNLPSIRNMVRNTLTRSFVNNRWWINDPDCIVLSDNDYEQHNDLPLNYEQNIAILTVKSLCAGSVFLSDDLALISPQNLLLLSKILPPPGSSAVALDILESEIPELLRVNFNEGTYLIIVDGGDNKNIGNEGFKVCSVGGGSDKASGLANINNSTISEIYYEDNYSVVTLCNWSEEICNKEFDLIKVLNLNESVTLDEVILLHFFDFWHGFSDYVYLKKNHSSQLNRGMTWDFSTNPNSIGNGDIIIGGNDANRIIFRVNNMPVHSCRVFRFKVQFISSNRDIVGIDGCCNVSRSFCSSIPVFVGADIHISCGQEIESITYNVDRATDSSVKKSSRGLGVGVLDRSDRHNLSILLHKSFFIKNSTLRRNQEIIESKKSGDCKASEVSVKDINIWLFLPIPEDGSDQSDHLPSASFFSIVKQVKGASSQHNPSNPSSSIVSTRSSSPSCFTVISVVFEEAVGEMPFDMDMNMDMDMEDKGHENDYERPEPDHQLEGSRTGRLGGIYKIQLKSSDGSPGSKESENSSSNNNDNDNNNNNNNNHNNVDNNDNYNNRNSNGNCSSGDKNRRELDDFDSFELAISW